MNKHNKSLDAMRETWNKFKRIETQSEADIDRLMALLSLNPSMTNPLMTATGREEVRNFLIADIAWSKPVYYWEVFEHNRLAIKWSQYPLENTKPEPRLLYSCATWSFDEHACLDHYYGTWCKVDCYEALLDAGIELNPEFFLGKQVLDIVRKKFT